eukprot:2029549-Prymnesium_polylepis.1
MCPWVVFETMGPGLCGPPELRVRDMGENVGGRLATWPPGNVATRPRGHPKHNLDVAYEPPQFMANFPQRVDILLVVPRDRVGD